MGSGRQEQELEMKRMAEEMRLKMNGRRDEMWCYHEERKSRRKAEMRCKQRLLSPEL